MSLEKKFEGIEYKKYIFENFKSNYKESILSKSNIKQCVQICDEFAVGFSDWKDKNTYPSPFEENKHSFFSWHNDNKEYTTTELLEIYKQGI